MILTNVQTLIKETISASDLVNLKGYDNVLYYYTPDDDHVIIQATDNTLSVTLGYEYAGKSDKGELFFDIDPHFTVIVRHRY